MERYISQTTSDPNWRTVERVFLLDGPFQLVWKGKRVKTASGEFGGGDLAVDDLQVTECDPADVTTSFGPSTLTLGKMKALLTTNNVSQGLPQMVGTWGYVLFV